jgi:glycosyltransferase involved in cell wall biosynthesis
VRILHVNKFLYRRGGAEAYMLDLAALQREAGHAVAVWGMHHPENPAGLPLEDTFAPHVELDPPPGGIAGLAAGGRMIWSPSSARGIAAALVRFRPDVVHCHNVYHQLSPSILRAVARTGTRCVMTLHDYKLACPSYQMLDHGRPCRACVDGGVRQAALRRCKGGSLPASALLSVESGLHRHLGAYSPVDVLVSPSRFLADVMTDAGVDRGRLRVINHFVDLGEAGTERATPRAGGFVFAGRLSHEKGVDTLVRAVALAPGTTLDVAGDGPERAALERLAAQVAPGRVRFHGRLDKQDLRPLVAGALATVVPSRWYENQPMTILESYALEVPVVVTAMGGMPELVEDRTDGLVVPHDDPAALAAALSELAADPARSVAMGAKGRARLAAEFAPGLHLERLERAYRP